MSTPEEFFRAMQEIKARGVQAGIPNVTLLNAQFLSFLLRTKNATRILEVGTANGYSTLWLAQAAKATGGSVISIEMNLQALEEAKKNASALGLSDIVSFMEGDAETLLPYLQETFDFVFIDARKASYLAYFQGIKEKLLPNAVVVFDDVIAFKHKMLDLYAYMEKNHPYQHFVVPVDGEDGVMLYMHTTS